MEKLGPTHPLVTTTISSQWALWTSCICASFNSLSTKSFIYFLPISFMENSRAIGIMTFPPSINWNSLLHTLCANDSLHKCYPLTSIWSNTTFLNLFHDMFMKNIQSFIKSLGLWIYRHINVGAHFCIVFQNNIHTIWMKPSFGVYNVLVPLSNHENLLCKIICKNMNNHKIKFQITKIIRNKLT